MARHRAGGVPGERAGHEAEAAPELRRDGEDRSAGEGGGAGGGA